MKTIDDTRTLPYIPNGLKEVWEWKEEMYQRTKNLTDEEFDKYVTQSVQEVLDECGFEKVLDPDGVWRIHKKQQQKNIIN